jgi:hypothetical protein
VEGDGAEVAFVLGEDSRDQGVARGLGEGGVAEDERGGAPEVAPTPGEGGGFGGFGYGEVLGDDLVEEVVAEGAEAVPPAAGSGEGGGAVGHGGEARRGFGLILVEMERRPSGLDQPGMF